MSFRVHLGIFYNYVSKNYVVLESVRQDPAQITPPISYEHTFVTAGTQRSPRLLGQHVVYSTLLPATNAVLPFPTPHPLVRPGSLSARHGAPPPP